MADRLRARAAAHAGQRLEAGGYGALRQLGREPRQPRSGGERAVGRSDLGRDDDRVLHLHGRAWRGTDRVQIRPGMIKKVIVGVAASTIILAPALGLLAAGPATITC